MIEIKAPDFPESVDEGTLLAWHVADGGRVERDDKIADVETDKVVLEVFAVEDGVIKIIKDEGAVLQRGDILATLDGNGAAPAKAPAEAPAVAPAVAPAEVPAEAPAEAPAEVPAEAPAEAPGPAGGNGLKGISPSVRKLIQEHGIDPQALAGSGKEGRILKSDVEAYIARKDAPAEAPASAPKAAPAEKPPSPPMQTGEGQQRVPMSRIRARIADRLVEVQRNAAILTTFNEVNMHPVMELRRKYKERFQEEFGTKLGLMSFFVKAAAEALKKFPAVNAFVDGSDIIYNEQFHIGIAVDSPRGLLVPVLRNADRLSFAEIEVQIREYAAKAKDARIQYEELVGGTFTITNGGVFGSMLSTPILNAPQSGILGMHTITDRPVAENGEVVIRPVMYLALSYDHRIVDGRGAVQFLVSIKESLEDPAQLLLQL